MLYKVTFYGTSRSDGNRYCTEFIVDEDSAGAAEIWVKAGYSDLPTFHTPVFKTEMVGRLYSLGTREVPLPTGDGGPPLIVSGDGESGA